MLTSLPVNEPTATTNDSQANKTVSTVKADYTHRLLAKFIDFLIAVTLSRILPYYVGPLAAATYFLIADGLPPRGQSLGKRLIGLRVVVKPNVADPAPCSWKQSMLRNLPFALCCFGTVFGFLGLLIFIAGLILIAFETYFVFSDDQGIRVGDIFANTKVLDV